MPGENPPKSKVVVLGAGVAGLRIAKQVSSNINLTEWEVVLIDENDYHQYLYKIQEVCNVEYDEKDIIVPIRKLIDENKITFKKASVQSIDASRKVVVTNSGEEPYAILTIALGSHPAYFNIPGIRENSMTLGNYKEAQILRNRIHELVKEAEGKTAPRIVIGGAGFTGVELAGELINALPVLFSEHNIPQPTTLLTIVEALSTILPGWNGELIDRGQNFLRKSGVELIFNDPIAKVGEKQIEMKSGRVIESDLFIWTGGVTSDPSCSVGFEFRNRRILVDSFCKAKGYEDVYVAGDMACTTDKDNIPQPPTAHIAMMQGDVVAHNIESKIMGGNEVEYSFNRVGEIVTLGRRDAVGDLFGLSFKGDLAKLMKKAVHWWYVYSIGGLALLFG